MAVLSPRPSARRASRNHSAMLRRSGTTIGAAGIAATVPHPRPNAAPGCGCEASHDWTRSSATGRASRVARVALVYPTLRVDPERDAFVVWVRWVSFERPPSPEDPPAQGVRVELMLNRNSVLGPTITY